MRPRPAWSSFAGFWQRFEGRLVANDERKCGIESRTTSRAIGRPDRFVSVTGDRILANESLKGFVAEVQDSSVDAVFPDLLLSKRALATNSGPSQELRWPTYASTNSPSVHAHPQRADCQFSDRSRIISYRITLPWTPLFEAALPWPRASRIFSIYVLGKSR